MVVCLWDLAGADGALVVVGAVEAVEAKLCWELVVVEIPHQLAFAAPDFGHPLPDRRPVQLGSCNFGPSTTHEEAVYFGSTLVQVSVDGFDAPSH